MRSGSLRPMDAAASVLLVMVAVVAVAGCGGGGNTSSVTGKVVANGQPVTAGSITFMPVDGKDAQPAGGAIQSDGTFKMMTDNKEGASIGKHQVSYVPPQLEAPEWDGYGQQPPTPTSPFQGMVPKETQVEVKSGTNDLTIELVPGGPR